MTFLFKTLFFFFNCKLIYIESLARVETLSLSGNISRFFVDKFLIQWKQLEIYYNTEYQGRLV